MQEQQRPLILFFLCYPRDNYYLLPTARRRRVCARSGKGSAERDDPGAPVLDARGGTVCVNCVESSAEPHEAWRGTPFVYFYDL